MISLSSNTCLKCAKPLTGRSDKRFCDSFCRNSYNNQVKSTEEQNINRINVIIRKNRRILKTLSPEGKAIVRKDIADNLGLDFNHFSAIHNTKQGVYYLCYDYGFRAIVDNGKEKLQIVQQQEYMQGFNPWKYLKKNN